MRAAGMGGGGISRLLSLGSIGGGPDIGIATNTGSGAGVCRSNIVGFGLGSPNVTFCLRPLFDIFG